MDYIFDTHAHYDDDAFDADREDLLKGMTSSGIRKIVNVGASVASCHQALALSGQFESVYCALGVHPDEVGDLNEEVFAWMKREAAESTKCVAIGEIGLDYHWDTHPRELQKEWFVRQMDLARELSLPIIVHSRDACQDTIEIMQEQKAGEIGGVIHCYSYSREAAKNFLDMGFYFGIGGVLTYKNAKKLVETVEYLPLERMVLETDCPYLSPVPFRGQRNSSLNIPYVVEKIAEIKGISTQEVCEATWKNAHALYRMTESF